MAVVGDLELLILSDDFIGWLVVPGRLLAELVVNAAVVFTTTFGFSDGSVWNSGVGELSFLLTGFMLT